MIQEANLHWRYIDTESNLLLPWYALPALQWLKKQDVKGWKVFEYGCGYSTIWWAKNCTRLNSVDHIPGWVLTFGSISLSDKDEYITCIDPGQNRFLNNVNQYDCIIVDGEWRDKCASFSLSFLKPGGFMIVDNYGQDGFPDPGIIDEILSGWAKQIFKQPNHSDWSTAIFCKP